MTPKQPPKPEQVSGIPYLPAESHETVPPREPATLGLFTPEQLGVPDGDGFLFPNNDIIPYHSVIKRHPHAIRIGGEPATFGIATNAEPPQHIPLFERRNTQEFLSTIGLADSSAVEEGLITPQLIEEFMHTITELNFTVDAYMELGETSRYQLLYFLLHREIEARNGTPSWSLNSQTRNALIKEILLQYEDLSVELGLGHTSDLLEDTKIHGAIMNALYRGDKKAAQFWMKAAPLFFTLSSQYLGAVLKAGMLPEDLSKEDLIRMTTTLVKAENDPSPAVLFTEQAQAYYQDAEIDVPDPRTLAFREQAAQADLSSIQKRISAYSGIALDAAFAKVAPGAFSLTNQTLLQKLHLEDPSYLTRARVANNTLDPLNMKLPTFNKELLFRQSGVNQGFAEMFPVFFAHKSNFSALASALNRSIEELQSFLEDQGRALLDHATSQLEYDFALIEAFNLILDEYMQGNDEEIEHYISHVEQLVANTPDLVRATAIIDYSTLEQTITEALDMGYPVYLVCNHHADLRPHPQITKIERGDATTADDINDIVKRQIPAWYVDNRENFPYAAIHIFGPFAQSRSIQQEVYMENGETVYRNRANVTGELRLCPDEFRRQFLESRLPFKDAEVFGAEQYPRPGE